MYQILESLYLGDVQSACNERRLREMGITHIVNCTRELPCSFPEQFTYLHLNLQDPDPAFHAHLAKVCAFIDEGRRQGKVLVHCFAATSRSPAVILAYLCHQGDSLGRAARRLSRIILTNPDPLFLRQLADHLGLRCTSAQLESLSETLLGRR